MFVALGKLQRIGHPAFCTQDAQGAASDTNLSDELRQAIAETVRTELAKIVPALQQATASRSSTRFVKVNETIRELNCRRTHLYRLFEEKKLTPINRGGSTLVDRDQLDDYIAKLRAGVRVEGAPSP